MVTCHLGEYGAREHGIWSVGNVPKKGASDGPMSRFAQLSHDGPDALVWAGSHLWYTLVIFHGFVFSR